MRRQDPSATQRPSFAVPYAAGEFIHPRTDDCRRACYYDGDVSRVALLLNEGVNLNQRAPCSGAAPLDASLWGGHLELFRSLVDRGADVNGVGYSDHTALMAATNQVLLSAVELLLERGADPNLCSPTTGETPLHQAATHGYRHELNACMRALLQAGADPNVKTTAGAPADTFIGDSVTLVGEDSTRSSSSFRRR